MTEAPPLAWDGMPDTPPDDEPTPATSRAPRPVNGRRNPAAPTGPPADLDAERAVLGAALLRPDLVPELAAVVGDKDWYHPAHDAIWNAIADRAATGQPVDTLSIASAIGTHRAVLGLGGPLYINQLANDPAVLPSAAVSHAHIVAAHADARRTAELGQKLIQAAGNGTDQDTIDNWLAKHLEQHARIAGAAASTWAPVDLTDILDGTAPDLRPALMARSDGPCLLYPGAVHLLSGEPTSGKTWLALLAMCDEMRAGRDVVLVDFEDRAATATGRLLALGATPSQLLTHFGYVRPETALDTPGRAALACAVARASLVIIDGVTEAMTLHGLDLASNPDVAAFYALLPRWVAGHGPTVVMIDHVVKDTERQGRWSIGGQHKVAGIDGAAYTVKNVEPLGRGKRGSSRVYISKDRPGHVEEHALGRCAAELHIDSTDPNVSVATLDPPEAMPTSDGGDMRPTELMERVSRHLEINPGSTRAGIEGAGLGKAKYVRLAIQQLITEGHVSTTPGARNAIHHHLIEPFRRDGETSE